MIDFSLNYSKEDFKDFLKDFLPNDYKENKIGLDIDDKNSFFKNAEIIGSVNSLDKLVVLEVERFKAEKSNNFTQALKKISNKEKKLIVCFGSLYNCGNILNKN